MLLTMGILEFFRNLRLKSDLHSGRQSAMEALFREYADGIFHYALTITHNSSLAEDVVQQLFSDIISRPELLQNVFNIKSYLYQATRNRSLNALKRSQREEGEALFQTESPGLAPEERLALELALQALEPEQREVVILKIHHGLTFGEIGTALEISANTAASRYRYALKHLREHLQVKEVA
jgi:RNA polymerase sigma-70 factor (ECF subfamily)